MEATERLTFNPGLPQPHPRARAKAQPEPVAQPVSSGRAERYDKIAFRLLLFFTFVLMFRPQDTLPILDPLHLAELSGTSAVIALIAGRLSRGQPFVTPSRELIAMGVFAAWMLATAPFSVWPGGAVAVFTDLFSKVLVIFALIINTVTTRDRFEKLVLVIGAGTSYMAVRAVSDYFRGLNLVEGNRIGGMGGLFGNPNDMALNMVAFLPLAIVIALMRRDLLARAIGLIGVPLICATIIFTKSRGGTIGLVIMVAIFLFKIRSVRPGLGALILAAAIATVPMLPESFTSRMSSIFNPEEDPTGSREARKQLLREAYRTYLDHPAIGVGAGQFMNYSPDDRSRYVAWRETHNAPLQVAAELGTPGLLIFAFVIWSGFSAARSATRILRARAPADPRRRRLRLPLRGGEHERFTLYAAGFTASLAGWFVAAMFASVAYYWTLYLVVGLAIALRNIVANGAGAAPAVVAPPRRVVTR
jgi:putative inorganic carbon (HCO3(-)) transporter